MRREDDRLPVIARGHGLDPGPVGAESVEGPYDTVGVGGPGRDGGVLPQVVGGLLPEPADGEDEDGDEQSAAQGA